MNKRKGLAIALTALLAMLWGCAKESGPKEDNSGYVYVPEYLEMDIECNYINSVTSQGDYVFLNAVSWDEESGESANFLYKYDMMEKKGQVLALELDQNSNIGSMAAGAGDSILMIVNSYSYEEDENGEATNYSSKVELWTVSSEDGAVKDKKEISQIFEDPENSYVQYFSVDGQGNIYLGGGDNEIHVVDQNMNKVCDISADTWIHGMPASKEGDVYVSLYGEKGMELRKVELSAKKLGEPVQGLSGGYGNLEFITGSTRSFLVDSGSQVSVVDLSTGEEEELFKWIDADINSDSVFQRGELSDGRVWAMTRDYNEDGPASFELILLTRKKASEVSQKEKILYGAMWIDSNVKRAIIDFNKTNEKYRITVKAYAEDVEDYQTALTQLNADLTTSNCPDIISLSNVDFHMYVSKGILEDLYPYMQKSGIQKEDYLENIMKAYEVDGKLYGIFPNFYVSSTMAKAALVGEKTGWTLKEMLEFAEDKEPQNILSYGSRSSIFNYCIYNNIDEFIDWENGKCFFDGEDFVKTLEFAAKFPEEYDYQKEEEGISSRIRSDKILLMDASIGSVQEYQMMVGMFGEEVAFLGYPNSERKGNLIQSATGSMGLASKSKNKEGAWEFMQILLSQDYQDSFISSHGGYGFPIRKDSLEKQFEQDMTPEYFEDENGNKVENPKTTWGWDDFQMEIMAATQEEVDAVKRLIESAEKISGSVDEQLMNIITEESEPFFKGQKTAKDVAGIIQNRIQIYVNENS